jgi:DNA primase
VNTPSIFQRVRDGVDPGEYFHNRLPAMPVARRSGWVDGGLCPFHADKSPGSFRVNTENGMYRCFSCGAKGSDFIAFEATLLQSDPLTAARALALEWGVQ